MKYKYIILPLSLIAISCSNTVKKPIHKEFFVTQIDDDGTKKFSYSLVTSQQIKSRNKDPKSGARNKRGGHGARGGKGTRSRDSNQASGAMDYKKKMKVKFLNKLEKALYESAYCHEGYIKLEAIYDRQIAQYKGQCEENASKDDRSRFPNQ